MLRAVVFALALTGLTLLAAGVLDAAPLIFWGTSEELASVEHGRAAMLAGAAVTLVAAAVLAALRERRTAALIAFAAVLPVAAVLAAPHSSLGLFALVPALGAGVAATIPRLGAATVLGLLTLAAGAANGPAWGLVIGVATMLIAYAHARAGGREPRAALVSLAPGVGVAALAAVAVFTGAALAG